jgi:hypothetical protein
MIASDIGPPRPMKSRVCCSEGKCILLAVVLAGMLLSTACSSMPAPKICVVSHNRCSNRRSTFCVGEYNCSDVLVALQ